MPTAPTDPSTASMVQALGLGLIAARWLGEAALEFLNHRHVKQHADRVPEAFAGAVDAPTYARSIQYTLAKSRFNQVATAISTLVLLLVLLTQLLPWTYSGFTGRWGNSPAASAAFLVLIGIAFGVIDLPVDWYLQFRLEERFGFNTTTAGTWWLDRLKGTLLTVVLGYPLLVLVLKIVGWAGDAWWLWAWGVIVGFQFLLTLLAPVLILPLFNKFTPLPDGPLKDRLLALAQRTRFQARSLQVMDGSKRSRHSNAFFTGFGRFRKIVLFDTLIQQLDPAELEAVLAHEIGHFRKKHVPKMLAGSTLMLLAGLFTVAWLARQPWFFAAFGFPAADPAVALLLFTLLSGSVTFWFSPLLNLNSRRFEYQADAFAAEVMGEPRSLIGALRRLNTQNLSNLVPHPLYSGFHYSHPTLLERESAVLRAFPDARVAVTAPAS